MNGRKRIELVLTISIGFMISFVILCIYLNNHDKTLKNNNSSSSSPSSKFMPTIINGTIWEAGNEMVEIKMVSEQAEHDLESNCIYARVRLDIRPKINCQIDQVKFWPPEITVDPDGYLTVYAKKTGKESLFFGVSVPTSVMSNNDQIIVDRFVLDCKTN